MILLQLQIAQAFIERVLGGVDDDVATFVCAQGTLACVTA